MKKIVATVFVMILMLIVVYVSACKKTKEDPTPDTGIANESNEAQNEWDDVLKISEDAINTEGQAQRTTAGSPTVSIATISQGNFIGEITVDFGTGITGSDGRTRSGQIIIKYTGKYRTSGTIIQCTTNNYFVNGKQILGCRTVKNTNGRVFNVKDTGNSDSTGEARIIYPDGKFTTWTSDRVRTWTAGYGTLDLTDDVYSIIGTAQGSSRDLLHYDMNINNLIVRLGCYITYYIYIPSGGSISVSYPDGTRSIDYGNGTSCDRNITYTDTDGKKYEVSL
jgi:hypothetical protein